MKLAYFQNKIIMYSEAHYCLNNPNVSLNAFLKRMVLYDFISLRET